MILTQKIKKSAAERATKKVDKLLDYIFQKSLIDEVWKEIPWADSNYFVSNKGRVLSLCNSQPIILRPYNIGGYYKVSICGRDRKINRLVAQAFIDNPQNKPVVHHKDHNKLNNDVSNLEWATYKENTTAYHKYKREKASQEERENAAE